MAQGDVVVFAQAKLDIGLEGHQLETDVVKLGLVTSSVTPIETTSNPAWGAGGSTNLSTNQVTPGGNYSTGGPTIANNTYTLATATVTFDGDNISILQNASNPTNARWGIGWNDTNAIDAALFFLDLGGVTDLTAGDFSVTWNASGIFTLT
jgi:hypothetical protein